jgi:hypothetical protein
MLHKPIVNALWKSAINHTIFKCAAAETAETAYRTKIHIQLID